MTTEGDRQSVLRTAKVRTALKGDNSWIQRRNQTEEVEEGQEKPWIAEVRASRLNSDANDLASDNTPPAQEPVPPAPSDSSKSSGYLIRGVFTKTDQKPAASSTNGYIGTSGFTKKPSEGYKKIAPHTVRSNVVKTDLSEPSLSPEEQEKRTETASKTLSSTARKQRSYVMSAAKKYDSPSGNADSSASSATAFVAKRVVFGEDDDDDTSFSAEHSVEMSVDEPKSAKTSPVKSEVESSPKQSDTLNVLSGTLISTQEPASTKSVTQITSTETKVFQPESSIKTRITETITQSTVAPVAALKNSETAEPKLDSTAELSISTKPVQKTSDLNDNDFLDLTESNAEILVDPTPNTTDLLTGDSLPKTKEAKGSLDLLAVDVIPIDTTREKLTTDKRNTRTEITETVVQTEKTVLRESTSKSLVDSFSSHNDTLSGGSVSPKKKSVDSFPSHAELLSGNISPIENSVDPFASNTDLLTGSSLPKSEKTSVSLDFLADDVIPIDTTRDKLSTDRQSKVETTTTVTETTRVVKGSADPFDPIPITRESTKSSVDLFDPVAPDSSDRSYSVYRRTERRSYQDPDTETKTEPVFDPEPTDNSDRSYSVYRRTERRSYQDPDTETKTSDSSYSVYTRTEDSSFHEPDPETRKNLVYVKSYVNSSDQPRYSTSRYDTEYDYIRSSSSSYSYSTPSSSEGSTICTYCGGLVGNDSKITIEHLNISCHPECFKCAICSKPMGDFIHSMFLHGGRVHCENCYANVI